LAGVGAAGDPLHGQADVADRLELVEDGVVDGALEGLAAAPGPAVRRRTGRRRRGVRRSGHGRPPKRILRILVNACVLNVGGVPSHALRTQSYTTRRDGTAHDSPAVGETTSARGGAPRAPSRPRAHGHRG